MSDEAAKKRGRPSVADPEYVRDVSVQVLSARLLERPDVLLANCKRDSLYVEKLRAKAVFEDGVVRSYLAAEAEVPADFKGDRTERVRYLWCLAQWDYTEEALIRWTKVNSGGQASMDFWKGKIEELKKKANKPDMVQRFARLRNARERVDTKHPLVVTAPSLAETVNVEDDFI